MTLLVSLENRIQDIVGKYAFVLDNGTILKSTISEQHLLKFTNVIRNICEQLEAGSYVHMKKLYIFRITEHFLLFLLSDLEEPVIEPLFEDIAAHYMIKLRREFSKPPKTVKSITKHTIFSMARAAGPEPIAWYPEMEEKDLMSITMKTMLSLTGELEGASKKVLSFLPFIQYNALGIIFLFQIPFETARGKAYDSSIALLVDYNDRAIIYEMHQKLENILSDLANELILCYHKAASANEKMIDNQIFKQKLIDLNNKLDNIPLQMSKSDKLMGEMLNSIKSLKKI